MSSQAAGRNFPSRVPTSAVGTARGVQAGIVAWNWAVGAASSRWEPSDSSPCRHRRATSSGRPARTSSSVPATSVRDPVRPPRSGGPARNRAGGRRRVRAGAGGAPDRRSHLAEAERQPRSRPGRGEGHRRRRGPRAAGTSRGPVDLATRRPVRPGVRRPGNGLTPDGVDRDVVISPPAAPGASRCALPVALGQPRGPGVVVERERPGDGWVPPEHRVGANGATPESSRRQPGRAGHDWWRDHSPARLHDRGGRSQLGPAGPGVLPGGPALLALRPQPTSTQARRARVRPHTRVLSRRRAGEVELRPVARPGRATSATRTWSSPLAPGVTDTGHPDPPPTGGHGATQQPSVGHRVHRPVRALDGAGPQADPGGLPAGS